MDYTRIFKQAWRNVTSYRALWIFGLLLALTTASSADFTWSEPFRGSEEGWQGIQITREGKPGETISEALSETMKEAGKELEREFAKADRELESFYREVLGVPFRSNILALVTFLLWFFLAAFIIGRFLRYISETALIKMVDDQEETGEQRTVREGFRFGWSRTSWRLFLIDLVIDIPATILFILLFALVFTPLFLWELNIVSVGVMGIVLTSGLFFLFIFTAIIFSALVGVLKHFMRRACALEGLGVMDAIKRGFGILRQNLKDTGAIWLILVGLNIAWPLVVGLFAVLFVAVATIISGTLGLLTGLTATLFNAANPVVVGLIVGIPLFLLILIIPLLMLSAYKEVFESSTWTLLFRELVGVAALEELPLPELPEAPEADAAEGSNA